MNYLELCQSVARKSGTVPEPSSLSSVTGQVGRLASIVLWTAEAQRSIGNMRAEWSWLQGEFEGDTINGARRYTAASWNIERWASWRVSGPYDRSISCYDPALGATDEGFVQWMDWPEFYQTQLRGSSEPGRPVRYAISPAGEIVFSPVPDKAYRIRGLYTKTPKELVANSDTPDMPSRFHDVIVYRALLYLADNDEAVYQRGQWQIEFNRILSDLERECLPRIRITAEPFA